VADVFISYTHKDNARLSDEHAGWIDRFHEALTARLTVILGEPAQIWRDLKLQGSDLLNATIEAAVRDTKILISVVSPGYLKSEWCEKELRLFCEEASRGGGVRVGTKSRIVKVIKQPVDRAREAQTKPELADVLGYEFYRYDARGVPSEFDPSHGVDARREFLAKVNELAYHLAQMLEPVVRDEEASTMTAGAATIYVAHTGYDRAADRDRVCRELAQFGHAVLPEGIPEYGPGYADRVRADIARSRLSVHLVGSGYGVVPEGEERSIVELQYALAGEAASARADFRRITCMPRDLVIEDRRANAFAATLAGDPDFLVAPIETLKATIAGVLAGPAAPAPAIVADAGTVEAYLIYDPVDEADAVVIADALFDAGCDVRHPLFDGDERERREDHEASLASCDVVVIYSARTPELWLRTKLRDLTKAPGYGRARPFAARAVVFGDPVRPDKERFRSHDLLVVRAFGGLRGGTLDPLVEQVRRARRAAG
jgi:hypothetical protein